MENILQQEGIQYVIITNDDEAEAQVQPQGIIVPNEAIGHNDSYTSWATNVTKRLISLYKEYHAQVGVRIRKQKQLWEIISNVLNKEFNIKLTPSQVENKWRTLLRAYKSIVDNNNKTGRARKIFEFHHEMDEIFQKKKNINPEVLLSEDTIVSVPKNLKSTPSGSGLKVTVSENESGTSVLEMPPTCSKREYKVYTKKQKMLPRNEILEKIRLDREKQSEEILKKIDERIKIEKDKLLERKRHNEIQEERNKILQRYLENNIPLGSKDI